MFNFKVTLEVSATRQVINLLEAMLSEKLSKRTENDFLISFDENELNVEFCEVDLTEKWASKIISCGTVKKFSIKNQAEKKDELEKENSRIAEKKSETKSEESELEPAQEPESKSEEPEPEPAQELETKSEDPEKIADDVIPEKLSPEYILKIYEETGANTKKFGEMLADYVQIPDNIRIKKAFYELIEAVIETEKMSWFCIENSIKNNAKLFYEKAYYNYNTKALISISVKKKFNLTLLKFLKYIKEATENICKKETLDEDAELSEVSTSKETKTDVNIETETKVKLSEEGKIKTEAEIKPKEESQNEVEAEPEPEKNIENKVETEPEPTESLKKEAEVKLEPKEESEKQEETEIQPQVIKQANEKDEDVFDEYWSGIFKCMPKIITKDTSRIQKVSKKEKQFLAIDKSKPISSRIKEVLEIMEEFNLVADESFITFSEQIFTKAPVIKIEKSTPLYQKMRLLQWSKSLQRFVQKYYTNDPNFRVNVDKFLEEVREMIMTPEEIGKVK